MNKRERFQLSFEFLVDLFVLTAANIISFFICRIIGKVWIPETDDIIGYTVSVIFSFCVIFFGFSSSLDLSIQNRWTEFVSVLRNCLLTYMCHAVIMAMTKNTLLTSRYLYLISLFLFVAFSAIGRYILKRFLIFKFANSKMSSLAGIITVGERAEDIINKLSADWSKKIKGVILLDAIEENGIYKYHHCEKLTDESGNVIKVVNSELETVREIAGVPVVGNDDNLMDWVRTAALDEVFINIPYGNEKKATTYIEELEDMGITVHINIPTLENIIDESEYDNIKCSIYADYPMATLKAKEHNLNLLFIKRFADIIGAIVGIVISTPIILLTAIPLLIESPGPLIFKQQRIGRNGRIFNIYKLRSMYADAEERKKELMKNNKMDGLMFKMDNDPRITKVGKFIRKTSIDELPQFWNVLKGDMSLVGTRPPTVDEFEKYESHHKRRLSMRPGITGMWQVSGRSDITDFEEVVNLDCKYIDNWSLFLDFKILLKTIRVVLTRSGAE